MYDELIEIRNKVDKLIKECEYDSEYVGEFEHVGEMYGDNGKYDLYLSPKHTEKVLTWYEAKEYCESLNAELPTTGELQYLYDNYKDSFDGIGYWSSVERDSVNATILGFGTGSVYSPFSKHCGRNVRAVRRVEV
jgi:hypothetical protein